MKDRIFRLYTVLNNYCECKRISSSNADLAQDIYDGLAYTPGNIAREIEKFDNNLSKLEELSKSSNYDQDFLDSLASIYTDLMALHTATEEMTTELTKLIQIAHANNNV
jgi:hypothetical protein